MTTQNLSVVFCLSSGSPTEKPRFEIGSLAEAQKSLAESGLAIEVTDDFWWTLRPLSVSKSDRASFVAMGDTWRSTSRPFGHGGQVFTVIDLDRCETLEKAMAACHALGFDLGWRSESTRT